MSRFFAGIALPECARLLKAKAEMEALAKARGITLRESDPVDLHLTLYFFGFVVPEKLGNARAAIAAAATAASPFSLEIEGFGAFPDASEARVLWAGVARSRPLTDLHAKLADALAEHGFPREERAFAPHVTLARQKPPGPADALIQPWKKSTFESFRVEEILFYESRGGENRPRYLPLEKFALSGN